MTKAQEDFSHIGLAHDVDTARRYLQLHADLKKSKWNLVDASKISPRGYVDVGIFIVFNIEMVTLAPIQRHKVFTWNISCLEPATH